MRFHSLVCPFSGSLLRATPIVRTSKPLLVSQMSIVLSLPPDASMSPLSPTTTKHSIEFPAMLSKERNAQQFILFIESNGN